MNRDLKIVLFSEQELQTEVEFKSQLAEEASQKEITLVALSVNFSIEELCRILETEESRNSSLIIVTTEQEWEIAKSLKIAALPYVKDDVKANFSGAWMVAEGLEEIDLDFLRKVYQRYHHLPWTVIQTKRCYLREICLSDMQALFELYERPGVTDYMEGLYSWDEEYEYQKAYIDKMYGMFGFGMWLVCDAKTDEIIGRAGIEVRDFDEEFSQEVIKQMPQQMGGYQLEMGYLITPERQRQGLAYEICQALLDYAVKNLNYASINCMIEKENIASIQLVHKLGMKQMPVEGVNHMLWYTCNLGENKI